MKKLVPESKDSKFQKFLLGLLPECRHAGQLSCPMCAVLAAALRRVGQNKESLRRYM